MTDDLDLSGATILYVHPGDRLMFVVAAKLNVTQADDMRHRLAQFLAGVDVAVCDNTTQVITQAVPTADLVGGLPVDRSKLVAECVDGCVLTGDDHDCCAHLHGDCDGQGCDDCHQGLLWQVP